MTFVWRSQASPDLLFRVNPPFFPKIGYGDVSVAFVFALVVQEELRHVKTYSPGSDHCDSLADRHVPPQDIDVR